ncbi:unnamed protein product [Adineta ricciae]|uniref:Uncharacterized protein n=1 Tax=Adineta ricciae TaxID=249248 RepID=A0A813UB46_ADIRI|nr:unnamed protein product [Adineta ricciae]CAF1599960.1 unnamed protein product [Adineta ricciae]
MKIVNTVSRDEEHADVSKDHKGIYWRLLFLNLVVLWTYHSLMSAQNYYIKYFPTSRLEFWGTVLAGSVMLFCHIGQLFGFYKYGFTKRIIPGFLGYIIIGILVMSWKNPIILLIAFGTVGALNTLTESPVYAISGLFPIGSFTQAVQVGNAIAGFLNVSINTILRLIVLLVHSHIDQDQLSFFLFMSVGILLSFLAIYVYYQLIHIPSIQIRIQQQMIAFKQTKHDDVVDLHLIRNELSYWQLTKILKPHLFVQFYTLFITLLLWPGIPCNASKHGWFQYGGHLWWCSPFVIGTFNLGDLVGRIVAIKIYQYFSTKILFIASILRTFFVLIIIFRHGIDNIFLLLLITLLGFTNGLLATVAFMYRPSAIVGVNNYEKAAYLMASALYFGIASGSIVAASLSSSHVLE